MLCTGRICEILTISRKYWQYLQYTDRIFEILTVFILFWQYLLCIGSILRKLAEYLEIS